MNYPGCDVLTVSIRIPTDLKRLGRSLESCLLGQYVEFDSHQFLMTVIRADAVDKSAVPSPVQL